jgi:hypothetical protein
MFARMVGSVDEYLLNPLQHAAAKDAPADLVRAMLAARPDVAPTSLDSRRRSLLHLAAAANADTEVIELLLEHVPVAAGAGARDLNDRLPVDYLLDHPDADTVGAQARRRRRRPSSSSSSSSSSSRRRRHRRRRRRRARLLRALSFGRLVGGAHALAHRLAGVCACACVRACVCVCVRACGVCAGREKKQESIFALLRAHPAVLWHHPTRLKLLGVAADNIAEVATVVKEALQTQVRPWAERTHAA